MAKAKRIEESRPTQKKPPQVGIRTPGGRGVDLGPKASVKKPSQVKGQKPAITTKREPGKVYTVKRGDSLTKIAKAEGTSLSSILALNPRLKTDAKYAGGNRIFAGTRVRLK